MTKHDFGILYSLMPLQPNKNKAKYIPTVESHLDINAIAKAESGDLDGALALLSEAITQYPDVPSLWNNRAQAHRLLNNDGAALSDLLQAKELLKSRYDAYTSLKVHEQLGWLAFKQGKSDKARKYFEIAASLGSEDAKLMSVRCNPYAELCNAMFREAMSHNVCFSKP